MSYAGLSRRELQCMCKEYGLPANKTNAAMASSLTAFLGDPRTNVLARAPQILIPAVAKNSNRAKVKVETQETSLAALILGARPGDLDSQVKIAKKGREGPGTRIVKGDLSAFPVSAPSTIEADCMVPKSTPLLRRRKPQAIPGAGVEEIVSCPDFGQAKEHSTCEPKFVPDLNPAALDTYDEGCDTVHQHDIAESCPGVEVEFGMQTSSSESDSVASSPARDQGSETRECCKDHVQPALFRITADVDKLIHRASAMLEKFQEWKSDPTHGPGTNISVGS